jgi:hypothetical protein
MVSGKTGYIVAQNTGFNSESEQILPLLRIKANLLERPHRRLEPGVLGDTQHLHAAAWPVYGTQSPDFEDPLQLLDRYIP